MRKNEAKATGQLESSLQPYFKAFIYVRSLCFADQFSIILKLLITMTQISF